MSITATELIAPDAEELAFAANPPTTISTEAFLALADEPNTHREIIDGQLVELPMTTSNARHSAVAGILAQHLWNWFGKPDMGRGVIVTNDARCRLQGDPKPTIVGIDVAYFVGETARRGMDLGYFDGPPVLSVEILSPSDQHGDVVRKVRLYLASGVRQTWIVDPELRYVIVHRPEGGPTLYHDQHSLPGGDDLPGFAVPVASLFP